MFEKQLPAHPNLEQYKKQAKDLVRDANLRLPEALSRFHRNHPHVHKLSPVQLNALRVSLTEAQLVLAREHGFESWPKFAHYIETQALIESVASLGDPVSTFLEVATIPRHTGHSSGTLQHAEMIIARYPQVATANIYSAAVLADDALVRRFLATHPALATARGGPLGWDALTYLSFSRYLRLDKSRSEAFVHTARTLLDAGASADTGWHETIDHPNPRQILESALYGVAGIAQHAKLTRLLLERGADPNDEETPYHVPESYDNTVLKVLLESGRLNPKSLACIAIRKADWHDEAGLQLALEHGANPNFQEQFGHSPLHHSILRDNSLEMIQMLLDRGGDPYLVSTRYGQSAIALAARRGRADALALFQKRHFSLDLAPLDRLIAACAYADRTTALEMIGADPRLKAQLLAQGGTLLAEFAGNGNLEGVRTLLDLGIPANALYHEGDGYFGVAMLSTALHVAAWRARHPVVKELIARGAPVGALDGQGRTALALAVQACVDSYWKNRRAPDSVQALLEAGATTDGITLPCGYDAIDALLLPGNS